MNIIRADIYRIVRGKGLYITLALLLGLVTLVVASSTSNTVGIQMGELEKSLGIEEESVYTGLNAVAVLCANMDNFVWCMLPLLIFVAAPMFSNGAVKNTLSCGMSRVRLYFSKFALSAALSAGAMILYLAYGMLLGTILRGFGGPPPDGYWLTLLKTCASQLLLLLALNAVGIFLVFTTKRTAMVISIYITICLVPLIIIMILSENNPNLIWLYDYDLLGNIKKFGFINVLEAADLIKGYALGAFYLVVSTVAGLMLFKRAEIK